MIGVSVIGAGHWGPNLINSFNGLADARVVSVVDVDRTRLEAVASRFPGVRVGDDAEAEIRASDVDAVVVATPTRLHYEQSLSALQHGKHLLVEKPLADTVDRASELVDLADAMGRVLLVGHVFLYNPAVQRAKQYLDEGYLGRVYYASMVRTNLGPIRVDVNAAWDLAAHDISIANYWLDAVPTAVSAVGNSWINPGIEDATFMTLRYPDDVLIHIHASWLSPKKGRDITVIGDRRMLTFDDVNLTEPIRIYEKTVRDEKQVMPFVDSFASFRTMVRDGDVLIPKIPITAPLQAECADFIGCIRDGRKPVSSGAEGLAVVRALAAVSRSLEMRGTEVCI